MSFLFFLTIFLTAGCSSTSGVQTLLVFEQDGTLTSTTSSAQPIKAGEERFIDERSPMLYESRGHLPVLVLPPQPGAEKVGLRLKPLGADESLSQEMDRVLGDILRVQVLLRDRKNKEALTIADDLLGRYPAAQQLRKLKAGCLMVLGEKRAAEALLESTPEPEPAMKPETMPEEVTP